MLTSLPRATTTFLTVLPVEVTGHLRIGERQRSRRSVFADVGRHRHAPAHLAVDLHGHDDLLGAFATASSNSGQPAATMPAGVAERSHSSSAMCGVNGESIRTSASTASFSTAIVAGRSTAPT